jgi:hypothetical protein
MVGGELASSAAASGCSLNVKLRATMQRSHPGGQALQAIDITIYSY